MTGPVSTGSADGLVANRERGLRLLQEIPTGLRIDGQAVESVNGGVITVLNPATGRAIAEVAEASAPDIDRAVRAAGRAFSGEWSQLPASRRGALLWELASALADRAADFALVETLDNGKPLELARSDIDASVEVFRYYAGWVGKIDGRSVAPVTMPDWRATTLRQPLGVVGQIIPWNFPLNMASWKVGPALATGNTVVLKPSELTPLTALMLADLITEVGFPPGVVNVVPGYGPTAGAALTTHPVVSKIAFTGSVASGRTVARAVIDDFKRVSLELGGKSPSIVLPDADPDVAIAGVCRAIFTNQGEVCTAGSRAYVHASIYDQVVEGVTARARSLRIGDGLDPASEVGPLVSRTQLDRVRGFVARAEEEGATVVPSPSPESSGGTIDPGGFYETPSVVLEPSERSEIHRDEVFGPVLVVQRFEDVDDVVRRANDSPFGLAAGIWGRDVSTVTSLAERLEAGSVWVNGYHAVDPALPFGGYKSSGWGRELGPDALDLYTETKSVSVYLGSAQLSV